MKRTRPLLLGLLLVIVSGCAPRSDWIQGTLVTVDATGRWAGNMSGPTTAVSGLFDVTLRQTGAKVAGDLKLTAGNATLWNGPIEGTIRGDLLKFSRPDGRLWGEVIVAGDEMSGFVVFGPGTRTLRLQRQP